MLWSDALKSNIKVVNTKELQVGNAYSICHMQANEPVPPVSTQDDFVSDDDSDGGISVSYDLSISELPMVIQTMK